MPRRRRYDADCYCHTCGKSFNYMGIARHRAMHRDKREDCTITYSNGTFTHRFSKPMPIVVVEPPVPEGE
jgi:hypothetical protein